MANRKITIDYRMSLIDLIDNTKTDKNTVHSYLELYQRLLAPKEHTAKNVLEVGIYDGGSIKLWSDFFTNATVYGLDIMPKTKVWEKIQNNPNIRLYTEQNAYDDAFFQKTFLDENIRFDFMLDDGPHTLDSMLQFIRLYSQIMTEDGILIIEDVQSINWLPTLKSAVPAHLSPFVKTYDLRGNKGRYDDVVFTIDCSNRNSM